MSRYPNLDRSILEVALAALESQKTQIEALIESAKRQLASRPAAAQAESEDEPAVAVPAKRGPGRPKGRKRALSPEARASISAAQRKRWAATKKEATDAPAGEKAAAKKTAKKKSRATTKGKRGGKRVLSPEARQRIAEAQRKRWAATRKAE